MSTKPHIAVCEHGCVHLTLNGITLHLTPAEFAALADLCQHALEAFAARCDRGESACTRLSH